MRKKPKLSSKRPRFLENLEIPAPSNVPVMMPSKVFENVQEQLQAKKIQMKIPEAIVHEQPQETTNPGKMDTRNNHYMLNWKKE